MVYIWCWNFYPERKKMDRFATETWHLRAAKTRLFSRSFRKGSWKQTWPILDTLQKHNSWLVNTIMYSAKNTSTYCIQSVSHRKRSDLWNDSGMPSWIRKLGCSSTNFCSPISLMELRIPAAPLMPCFLFFGGMCYIYYSIVFYSIVLNCIMLYYITCCYIMLYYVILLTLCYIILHYITLYYIILYHITLCYSILYM